MVFGPQKTEKTCGAKTLVDFLVEFRQKHCKIMEGSRVRCWEKMLASHKKNTKLVELHLKICCASGLASSTCFVRVFPSLGIAWYSEPSKCSINNFSRMPCINAYRRNYFERHLSKERLKSATKPRQNSRRFVGTNLQFPTIYVVFYSLHAIPPTVQSSGWTKNPRSKQCTILMITVVSGNIPM